MGACSLTTWISLFVVVVVPSAVVSGQEIIPAQSGQNVTFLCRAPNNISIHVKWSRTDLGEEYALLYRDDLYVSGNQHPSFVNRVDLQDIQMTNGDASLILKNVTTADAGTYTCQVLERVGEEMRLSNTITLIVDPPGQPGGHTEDGVKEADEKEAEEKEAEGKEADEKEADEKEAEGNDAVIYGLTAVLLCLLFTVGFSLIYRKYKAQQKQGSYKPATEIQLV